MPDARQVVQGVNSLFPSSFGFARFHRGALRVRTEGNARQPDVRVQLSGATLAARFALYPSLCRSEPVPEPGQRIPEDQKTKANHLRNLYPRWRPRDDQLRVCLRRTSSRISRNSLGPFRSRCFRCWRSSLEAD